MARKRTLKPREKKDRKKQKVGSSSDLKDDDIMEWTVAHDEELKLARRETAHNKNKWRQILNSGKYKLLNGWTDDQLRYRWGVIQTKNQEGDKGTDDTQGTNNSEQTKIQEGDKGTDDTQGTNTSEADGKEYKTGSKPKKTSLRVLDVVIRNNHLLKKIARRVKMIAKRLRKNDVVGEKKGSRGDANADVVVDPRPGRAIPDSRYRRLYLRKLLRRFLASANTENNLETCGLLAGVQGIMDIQITALIIPKQTATSNTCDVINEVEQVTAFADNHVESLGWIHTHPTQFCFLSSIDLHTQLGYQALIPESVSIVLAPKDKNCPVGIFQLTDPVGMDLIRNCHLTGFHQHTVPLDAGDIYQHCSYVVRVDREITVIDLRN